jgi:UDP-glucose 4-epimerase
MEEKAARSISQTPAANSVREVIATAEQVIGKPIRVEIAPRRLGDSAVLIGSSERARDLLGWKPARSELAVHIQDAWNWMKKSEPN